MSIGITAGLNYQVGTHANRLLASPSRNAFWKESDTNLIYIGDGSAWQIFKGDGYVLKTADETVNNSATLQDDDHLFFPIEVNERWFVECLLMLSGASTTADWKFAWTVPAGATGAYRDYQSTAWVSVSTGTTPAAVLGLGSSLPIGGNTGTTLVHIAGWVLADATHAGTVQFRWAQNTATAEDNKVLAGSYMRLRRLA